MADIVNLNRFKKSQAKIEKSKLADANRLKFGQSKTEKLKTQKQNELNLRNLDGHKREDK